MAGERPNILLTGSAGMLGKAILQHPRAEQYEFDTPTHQQLNISKIDSVFAYAQDREFDAIINCAAVSSQKMCDQDPDRALRVNMWGPFNVARLARVRSLPLVHISTVSVFPSSLEDKPYKESAIPHEPTNLYGLTKLMGEWMVTRIAQLRAYLLIRSGWMFGPEPNVDHSVVADSLNQLAQGSKVLEGTTDQLTSPTYAVDVAGKILEYVEDGTQGLRHLANKGSATRHAVAKEIVKQWDNSANVRGALPPERDDLVQRGHFAVLETQYPDARMRTWQSALADYHKRFPTIDDFRMTGTVYQAPSARKSGSVLLARHPMLTTGELGAPGSQSTEQYPPPDRGRGAAVVERVQTKNLQIKPETLSHHVARYKFATTVQTPSGRALDVCCGTGYGTEILRASGYDAFGFDISQEAIEEARANYQLCNFEVADALTYDYGDNKLVTFFEAIEHLLREEGIASIKKAHESLPSGIFVVSTPRNIQRGSNPYHKYQWEFDELRDILGSVFSTVDMLGQDWETGSITEINARDKAFYIAVCTK